MKEERFRKVFRNTFYSSIIYLISTIGFYYYFVSNTSYKLENLFDTDFDNMFELFIIITIVFISISIWAYGMKTYHNRKNNSR